MRTRVNGKNETIVYFLYRTLVVVANGRDILIFILIGVCVCVCAILRDIPILLPYIIL